MNQRFTSNNRENYRAIEEIQRDMLRDVERDQVFEHPRRLVVRSPDGHHWGITVDNTGALVTTDLGEELP